MAVDLSYYTLYTKNYNSLSGNAQVSLTAKSARFRGLYYTVLRKAQHIPLMKKTKLRRREPKLAFFLVIDRSTWLQ